MDSTYILGPNGELYHHGTKGMKWGIRRYQNKDGSLTPAGKKRYKATEEELKAREKVIRNTERLRAKQAKLAAKKAELDAREKALQEDVKPKPKTAKDMTDDELKDRTARLNLEKNYNEAVKNTTPEVKVGRGKRFVNTFADKLTDGLAEKAGTAVADLAAQTMKSVGAKYINELLGKGFGDEIEKVFTNNKK
jgi:hypothetical protein